MLAMCSRQILRKCGSLGLALVSLLSLTACGSGGGELAYSSTVAAEVNGFESGPTLDLRLNGNETLNVTSNGKSAFKSSLPVASGYSVSLKDKQPPGFQWCVINNGTGTVKDSENIVAVNCTASSGDVTTIAGIAGVTGSNNGPAASATFDSPRGMVFDSNGNLYIADSDNKVIRKIDTDGNVSVFAGQQGVSGSDDGPLGTGKFGGPHYGITVDKDDNLYVTDTLNHTIRKIDTNGTITTIAGRSGVRGFADGAALSATFSNPQGLAFDSLGNLFVVDSGNYLIRKIGTNGQVTTFAGTQATSYTPPLDGPLGVARLGIPYTLVIDNNDMLYLSDRSTGIRKIDKEGNVSSYTSNVSGIFDNATVVSRDLWGNFYTAGILGSSIIVKVAPSGATSILAGAQGSIGYADGKGALAKFSTITGMTVDKFGNLYTAEAFNHTIRKIVPASP